MKRKMLSIFLAAAVTAVLVTGCGNSRSGTTDTSDETQTNAETQSSDGSVENESTTVSTEGVSITLLNTKSEIQTQFEEMTEAYKEKTGVSIEVYVTTGDSPAEDIAKRYASGEAPTLFM